MKVLIGLSWPYANNRLHIGSIASSLPADALARFHRGIGNEVSFVSGSDCFGTPILVAAQKEGITPKELAMRYHEHHKRDFASFGFTFDEPDSKYSLTLCDEHKSFVQKFHTEMYKGGFIYEKTATQLYCEACKKFLPDRYVEGLCPHCKKEAKGDSCDHCSKILEPEDLLSPRCILCQGTPVAKEQTQLYIKLSALQDKLQKFFDERKDKWTTNAQGMTQRYLSEGLHDRAITRSMDWGIEIPKDGWDDKRIYIWAENVLGYLSASSPKFYSPLDKRGGAPTGVTGCVNDLLHIYVHGKDNIPFHSLILPGLLMAGGQGYHLPDLIVSSEYVTIGGAKISKSKGNIIPAHVMYENFDVDMVRYFFLRIMNDKRDSNFTPTDFVNIINGELVNNFGNLVNRTLSFIKTKFDGAIPKDRNHDPIEPYDNFHRRKVHELMLAGNTSQALKEIMEIVNFGNKYFADKKPWESLAQGNTEAAQEIISDVVFIIKLIVELIEPFIPFACAKVKTWLAGETLPEIDILFRRLDLEETSKILGGLNV